MYSQLYGRVKDALNINLPGLGQALRLVKGDRIIEVDGTRMQFCADVAESYGRLIGGSWNEPETHLLLEDLIRTADPPLVFLDIGAHVGEFVCHVANLSPECTILAFEPIPEVAQALRASAILQSATIEVIEAVVGDTIADIEFKVSKHRSNSSIHGPESARTLSSRQITIDSLGLPSNRGTTIMLIDVEGAELAVLKGASDFLVRHRPIVIFEYNHISQRHFSIAQVQEVLPTGYRICALERSGELSTRVGRTWNCVAVPPGVRSEQRFNAG